MWKPSRIANCPNKVIAYGELVPFISLMLRHLPPYLVKNPLLKASIPCVKWPRRPYRQRLPYMYMYASSNSRYHFPINVPWWCVPEHHSISSGQHSVKHPVKKLWTWRLYKQTVIIMSSLITYKKWHTIILVHKCCLKSSAMSNMQAYKVRGCKRRKDISEIWL